MNCKISGGGALPLWIDAKQLVIPSAVDSRDCPRVAD